MKGIQIFVHSIRQVTGNLPVAIRISLLPYAIQFIAALVLLGPEGMTGQADWGMTLSGANLSGLAALLLNLIIGVMTALWIAVAWHRYILRNELPTGYIPPFHRANATAYFVLSLVISIASALVAAFVLMLIVPILMAIVDYTTVEMILPALSILPAFILFCRLGAALPGVALDVSVPFLVGWTATKGESYEIFTLAVVYILFFGAGLLVGAKLLVGMTILLLVWNMVLGWVLTMVSLSILTTLYGHYVERRKLVMQGT